MQASAQIQEMMEDGAVDMLSAGHEAGEEAIEGGLNHGDIAAIGLGGGVAGMAVYQVAKALRSKTSGSQEHDQEGSDADQQPKDPHLAHVKLKLSVCFQNSPCWSGSCLPAHTHSCVAEEDGQCWQPQTFFTTYFSTLIRSSGVQSHVNFLVIFMTDGL